MKTMVNKIPIFNTLPVSHLNSVSTHAGPQHGYNMQHIFSSE